LQRGAQAGKTAETGGQGADIAGTGGVEREAGEKTFEIEQAIEGAANFFATNQVGNGLGDGFVAGFESGGIDERAKDGGAQKTLAHGGLAGIESVKKSGLVVLAGEERLNQFEISNCNLIEFESGGVLFKFETVDMEGFVFLRSTNVVKNRAGSDDRGIVTDEAEAFERVDTELTLDEREGEVAGPDPIVNAGAGGNAVELRGELRTGGSDDLAGTGLEDFINGLLASAGTGELGGAKFAGGDIEQSDGAESFGRFRGRFAAGVDLEPCGEKVVLLLAERGIESGAGGEDAGDFAAHDFFSELGIFHLVADGDAITHAQQACEVAFDGVIGDAAHRLGTLTVARGEGELKLAADGDGVVVKKLVKIAHAEEEQGVGIFALGRRPLAHEGG